jgi:hypothetical protein
MKCLICDLESEKYHEDCMEIAKKIIKKQKKKIIKLSESNQKYKLKLKQLKEKFKKWKVYARSC